MLEHSTLMNEIQEVLQGGPTPVHFMYSCKFVLPTGVAIGPLKMVSLDTIRDYSGCFADEIVLTVLFGAGTYSNEVYPHRNNLRITVQREYIGEVSDSVDLDQAVDTQEYRGYLLDMRDHNKEAKSPALDTVEQGDLAGMTKVQFQLVDAATEWLRSVTVGGVVRKGTPGDVLKTLLTTETQAMPISRQVEVASIDMVKPDNTRRRDHILIPHGMLLTQLPAYLQEKCGGIYNSDIGFYLQHKNWYVWPLYNTERFEDTPNGLTVINIPEGRFPGIERTYRQTRNQLVVLATGQTQSLDTASNMQQAMGHGIRFADAAGMFDSFGETVGNITKLSRGKNNTELKVKESLTGLNHIVSSVNRISGNLFSELSKLAIRQGQITMATWENSRGDLIYPGMPVKYLYEKNGRTFERRGVTITAQHYTQMAEQGVASRRYITNSTLTLFLNMDEVEV